MINYAILLFGIVATAGLLWILASAVINGADGEEIKRVGVLLSFSRIWSLN